MKYQRFQVPLNLGKPAPLSLLATNVVLIGPHHRKHTKVVVIGPRQFTLQLHSQAAAGQLKLAEIVTAGAAVLDALSSCRGDAEAAGPAVAAAALSP